jgi:replicative DNA helicase
VRFLHRPEMYAPKASPGVAEINVAKHRNGPTGIVKLTFKKQVMEFEDHVAVEEPSGGYFPGQ